MRPRLPLLAWLLIDILLSARGAGAEIALRKCEAGQQIRTLVEAALREGGFTQTAVPEGDGLICPSAIHEADSLEVVSVRPDALTRAVDVRLRCRLAGSCLPFVVRVPSRETTGSPRVRTLQAKAPPVQETAKPVIHEPVVRRGERVTLLWTQDGLRITRTVVCLDPGGAGQQVRTRGAAGGEIVRARVLRAGWVEAEP